MFWYEKTHFPRIGPKVPRIVRFWRKFCQFWVAGQNQVFLRFCVFSEVQVEECRFSSSGGSFSRFSERPGGVQERLWGFLGLPCGFLGSWCEIVKFPVVFDPKLGSMLDLKNAFFDVKNWKNAVSRGILKNMWFWDELEAQNELFLKSRNRQKCGFRLGGVQFLRKIAYRSWGLKKDLQGVVLGGFWGSKMRSKSEKWGSKGRLKSELFSRLLASLARRLSNFE